MRLPVISHLVLNLMKHRELILFRKENKQVLMVQFLVSKEYKFDVVLDGYTTSNELSDTE